MRNSFDQVLCYNHVITITAYSQVPITTEWGEAVMKEDLLCHGMDSNNISHALYRPYTSNTLFISFGIYIYLQQENIPVCLNEMSLSLHVGQCQ